jgi:hypothetical protein
MDINNTGQFIQPIVSNTSFPPEEKTQEFDQKELTDTQKLIVLKRWNDPNMLPASIKELTQLVFGGEFDGRSKQSTLIKKYLVEKGITARTSYEYQKRPGYELTEPQKEYIYNNSKNMSSLEMAEILFESKLAPNDSRVKEVKKYRDSLPKNVTVDEETEEKEGNLIIEKYSPPKTIEKAAARINRYILGGVDVDKIDKSDKIREKLKTIINNCHLFRFQRIINSYEMKTDKELFEASYIKYIWEMEDVSSSELDLICNLCVDIVNYSNMQQELEDLKGMRDTCADDTDGKRISMSIVESIGNLRKSLDENHKRQSQAIKSLQGERNNRIDTRTKENASLLQLIDFWKNHENRKQMIQVADLRKKDVENEIKRIETMDDLIIQVWGLDKNEILNS